MCLDIYRDRCPAARWTTQIINHQNSVPGWINKGIKTMATKRYNQKRFEADVNGVNYEFICYSTNTRCGFCHTVQTWRDYRNITTDTKTSYYNRTWERFDYETTLENAIKKCPAADRAGLRAAIIDRTANEERERTAAFVGTFGRVFGSLTDENKARVADAVGTIENEADARAALMFSALLSLGQERPDSDAGEAADGVNMATTDAGAAVVLPEAVTVEE